MKLNNRLTKILGLCSLLCIGLSAQAAVPKPPINLTASKNLTEAIKITWQASQGAEYYRVYRINSATGTKQAFATVSELTFTDLSPRPKTTFFYAVKACFADNKCSAFSVAVSGLAKAKVIEAPVNLTASEQLQGRVDLHWNIVLVAKEYRIYRDSALYAKTASNSFSDKSVTSNQPYNYTVKACDQFKICSAVSALAVGVAAPVTVVQDDSDILDMITPVLAAIKKPLDPPHLKFITFTSAPVSEQCAVSWDDSFQPTGTIHWITADYWPYPTLPHPEWKKQRHCINVVINGPTDAATLDDAQQYIVDEIKSKLGSCINDVLHEGETYRLFNLVAAIVTDILSEGSTGATYGVLVEYANHVRDGSLECMKQLPDFGVETAQSFADSFSTSVYPKTEWIYWDM